MGYTQETNGWILQDWARFRHRRQGPLELLFAPDLLRLPRVQGFGQSGKLASHRGHSRGLVLLRLGHLILDLLDLFA